MDKAPMIARYLLGVVFVVFGLNGFFNFLPAPEFGLKGMAYMKLLSSSGMLDVEKIIEVVAGLLLLSNKKIPIALTLAGPVLANILMFHIFFHVETIVIPAIMTVCFGFVFLEHKSAFSGILKG